ncbi:MAG: nitroreductase [Candidatus Mcinerneyibacterium aminivorans]|jgi:nitroreductase|uniref:Nitroreductase n=1 Tax=Candidatus Mcinerneyibacterium aminivorans TaxID=2703815 RepID=A0A5D0MEK3_9BACT|nr:MAG: nitroreductase [Candidatus Mcinerneyibacterium aminivorans]
MNIIDVIKKRRSIRKFQSKNVKNEIIKELLKTATKAPSAKNDQPWRFVILKNERKDKIADFMIENANELEKEGCGTGSIKPSAKTIKQAPVLIVVYNTNHKLYKDVEKKYRDIWRSVDIQSIGAVIQTLLLASVDKGIGTLWICDIFIAEEKINSYLKNKEDELVAAISLGYPAEEPPPVKRKHLDEVTEWQT